MLAEICGFAMASDSTDLLVPEVEGMSVVMRQALEEARLDPSEIDYVSAHGAGTRLGDLSETRAIKNVFGSLFYFISRRQAPYGLSVPKPAWSKAS